MNDSSPPTVASVTDNNGGNWRQSIAQSFRSEEVRSIAKVLASLEPGATSASKTMLAMKFEDSIFKAATDLDNYRLTIAKRINKLQKHYAKQLQQDATGEGEKSAENADQTREREILFESELREEYGSRLLYIFKHATSAIRSTREKQGDKKAETLQQHVNNAKQWAVHLGLHLPVTTTGGGGGATTLFVRQERRDMEFLNKLKGCLEIRVDNIRLHIIKMADPDYLLEEALAKMDDTLLKDTITEALRTAAATTTKDDNVRGGGNEEIECVIEQMQQFVERLNTPIPIPRRYQDGDVLKAAVARIEKFRAGAQALYTYIMLPVLDKTQYRGAMTKCFSVVMECLNDLENDYNNLVKEEEGDGNMLDKDGKRIIVLEDAWNNPMQFTELESSSDGEEETTPTIEMDKPPKTKRRKTNNDTTSSTTHESSSSTPRMVIRSRYLLTPGRKPLSTLLPALQRKRAILVRSSSLTFVKLVFGTAFEMTIYFVPLLVTIRAIDLARSSNNSIDDNNTVSTIGGLNWPSIYQGLQPIHNTKSSSGSNNSSLSVLGVTGPYEILGPIVAKQLEYASCQATCVLRRCFTEATAMGKYAFAKKKAESEIELLEAGAFIRFLRIARATYSPDLVDVDL